MIDDMVPDDWTRRLAAAVAATVRAIAPALRGARVAMLAVDCHPWHGSLALSVLTAPELDADPLLADPREMAAWRYYNASEGSAAWQPAELLGRQMRAAYEAAGDRAAAAAAFLRACARAAASADVTAAVELLERSGGFRISVSHPDDGQGFFPPASVPTA